jgi:serine-type D-Ala-D-Ala carboxypeptidase (penicillin-binding protein 5/6)
VIDTYPDLYAYFGKPEFTWNKIRQSNRNPLIAMGIGADGLKTGYITDSGYSLVGSTVQNGQRLIVVVTGLKTAKDREQEARKLLDFGYRAFESRDLFAANSIVGEAKVYGGAVGNVPLVSKVPVKILLPRGTTDKITARIVYNGPLMPPVEAGAEVARLRVIRGTTQALDLPLYAAEDVRQGGLVRRALDAAVEFGSGFIRRAFSKS